MKYNIEIEKVKSGQERPYADSVLEYKIIASGDIPENIDKVIEDFCTKILTNCNKKYNDNRMWYESYYYFKATAESNKKIKEYKFIVTSPYLD